jgi:hypothetical protein
MTGLLKLLSNAICREATFENDAGYEFMCSTCRTPFLYVSGVSHHAERDCCDEDFIHGKPL